jgi:hypothetical protein
MNLSSRTTYLFPFVLLLIPSFYFVDFFLRIDFYADELKEYLLYFLVSSILAAILYFSFRKAVGMLTKYKYLKYFLVFIPTIILSLVIRGIHLDFLSIVAGLFLFFSYSVFSNRYTGILTDEAIMYKNLLGQMGEINLKDIVKLEQKKNLLSIFREFKILDLSRKTGITFTDENLDEYEINIFTKVFKADNLFSIIIDKANKCGNLKIRQYTV